MKNKNKESEQLNETSSGISPWWMLTTFVMGFVFAMFLFLPTKLKPEPEPVTLHFEAKPAPEKVTHRVVSNGEKFAGQVLVTCGGCWDRWYQLETRDSWKEAQQDLQLGDLHAWDFKPVTEEEAEVIGFKNQIKHLESRVKALEPKPTNDWSSLTNYLKLDCLILTNEFHGTKSFINY